MNITRLSFVLFIFVIFTNCTNKKNINRKTINEIDLQEIDLSGRASIPDSEFSGMTIYKNNLILMPQFPVLFSNDSSCGKMFSIPLNRIEKYLNKTDSTPILPSEIEFNDYKLNEKIPSFDGYESIDFYGNTVYMTIESSPDKMMGFIIKGEIDSNMTTITLDTASIKKIKPQAEIYNATEESILIYNNKILTFFEGNGININKNPFAHVFDFDLNPIGKMKLQNLEYRITDATKIDSNGMFWIINYHWPRESNKYKPAPDTLVQKYGQGKSHQNVENVERLIEMQIVDNEIRLIDKAPVYLKQIPNYSRNLEGIVRYKNGFLLVTDKYPKTILGFLPLEN